MEQLQETDADDLAIRDAIVSGDAEATRCFVEEHRATVLRHAWRASGDRTVAEDIAQEVFVKALRRISDYRGDRPIGNWLARITSNCAIDALRKRKPEYAIDAVATRQLPARIQDPADEVERTDLQNRVRLAITKLPSDLREVIWMTVYNEMTYADTARELGIPLRTVMSRASTARVRLRRMMGDRMAELL